MKLVLLSTAAVALMGMAPSPAPIGAMVSRVGGSSAQSCYHAAVARDASAQAISACNAAVDADAVPFSDLVATYVNRGVLKLVQADYRSAEADFNRAISMQPSQPEAYLNKGISRFQQQDTKGAYEMFSRAIELKTNYAALAYFGRGLAAEDSGDIRGAYADLKRASDLEPKWDAPRDQLARFKVVRKPSA